ncbi:hypothetical protein [Micromonospora sp. NBC_01813]|uniref:hypothetical protein n=1 Tax=Micromonospora sp. NBC_01813 TaxID=2975988 RepID=UPI002DD7F25F|nr:hypothetical protein [Micromonospora sp. NBC_01813]WSA07711.1 hypothetical protein OG958_26330 [Micromonospora sp. NBC_01813]
MDPDDESPGESGRNRPLILLWAAAPLAVALVLVQFVGPEQPSKADSTVASSEAQPVPAAPLPAWPAPSFEPPATPSPTRSDLPGIPPAVGTPPPVSPAARPTELAQPTTPVSTPVAPAFTAVSVEAEAPGNLLAGGAKVASCATCDGGARVRYIDSASYLEVYATLPVAGTRTVTVRYESDGERKASVQVNGGPVTVYPVAGSGGWGTPSAFTFEAHLPAGRNTLRFSGLSPDIDRIIIS